MSGSTVREDSPYRLYIRRASLLGVTNLLVSLRGILLIPVIVKTLGAGVYGVWSQIMVVVFLASNLALLGLQSAITRFLSGDEERHQLREGFYSILFVGMAISLLCTIAALPALRLMPSITQDQVLAGSLYLALWLIPLSSANIVAMTYFIARRWISRYVAISLWRSFGEVFLIAFMILQGGGLRQVILGSIVVQSSAFLIMIFVIARHIGFELPDFSKLKEFLMLGLPTLLALLSQWIVTSSDRLVIGVFMGNKVVGIYSAAYGVGNFVFFFISPLSQIMVPTVVAFWEEGNQTRARMLLERTLKLFLLFTIPAFCGLTVLSGSILGLLATQEFVAEGRWIVPFVASTGILYGAYAVVVQAFNLMKNTRPVGITWAVAASANIAGNVILVPFIGTLGAAISTTVSYGLALLLAVAYADRYFLPRFPASFCVKSVAACTIMVLVLFGFRARGLPSLAVAVGVGACVYFACLWVFRGFSKPELDFLRALVSRRNLR